MSHYKGCNGADVHAIMMWDLQHAELQAVRLHGCYFRKKKEKKKLKPFCMDSGKLMVIPSFPLLFHIILSGLVSQATPLKVVYDFP